MNTNTANKEVFDKWLTWRSRSVKLPQLYTKSGNTSIRLSKPTSEIRDLCKKKTPLKQQKLNKKY